MIVKMNEDYFVVQKDDYHEFCKDFPDTIKIAEWIEMNGVFIDGSNYLILGRDEVAAVMKELENCYLTKENELFASVIVQMIAFLKRD